MKLIRLCRKELGQAFYILPSFVISTAIKFDYIRSDDLYKIINSLEMLLGLSLLSIQFFITNLFQIKHRFFKYLM